jgi:hypothetical protein
MNVLAWPLTALALVFMYPWARWLLNKSPIYYFDEIRIGTQRFPLARPSDKKPSRGQLEVFTALTTLALSVGTLSLVMLWIGLLGMPIDWRLTMLICVVISAIGWWLWSREKYVQDFVGYDIFRGWWRLPILIIAVICLLILFNAAYWPFGIDDAVTIYATFGKQIATTGQLPHGNLYETYPMLVPLTYAFTHQAAGWVDEHLAALIPAILSVGVVGVAYLLGGGFPHGIAAALLVVLTPMFTHWASAGYVDLPSGFFYGMTAYFLLRLHQFMPGRGDALLAGIMAGLSAWTKNSGLLIIISIGIYLTYQEGWYKGAKPKDRLGFEYAGLIIFGFLFTAAPWYIRNLTMAGVLIPPTGWTWQAERTFANLFPYIVDNRYFPIGWLYTVGVIAAIWRFWKKRSLHTALLPVFYVPFFVVWWLLFSYDGRFLLTLTPLVAAMTGDLVGSALEFLPRRLENLTPERVRLFRVGASMVILILAIPAASAAVDHKTELLRNPLMSEADKHRVRLGADRYDMAIYLRGLPPGSRVWTQDLLLPYNADGVKMTIGGWPTTADLAGYDYWVLSPGEVPPKWVRGEPVHVQGGYRLYSVPDSLK